MQVAALPTAVYRAANSRPAPELSPQAANQLMLIDQWEAMRGEGITAAKAADILRVPRASLYRWKSRLRKRGLSGLEPDSRRPRNVRRPQREPGLLQRFTARDVVSRCDVLQVGTQATSASAARFLEAVVARMPFPVKAIQADGGSEFQEALEEACSERGILLFARPPHSPKLNGHVERGRWTRVDEFSDFYDEELTMGPLTGRCGSGRCVTTRSGRISRLAG